MTHELAYTALKFLALCGLISIVGTIFVATCIIMHRNAMKD